jgi:hypothetical protein
VDQEAVFTLKAQDYEKKESKDAAAVAEVEVQSGGEKQTYSFVLLAPEGDINNVEEYAVVESDGYAKSRLHQNLDSAAGNSWTEVATVNPWPYFPATRMALPPVEQACAMSKPPLYPVGHLLESVGW